MPQADLQIYKEFLDGKSLWDIATHHGIAIDEVQVAIRDQRALYPKFATEEVGDFIECMLFEELARIQAYRTAADAGVEETETQNSTFENGATTCMQINRQKQMPSAVAALCREFRETLKLLAQMRGILKPDVAESNIAAIIDTLEKAPSAAEWKKIKSNADGQVAISDGRRTIPPDVPAK